MINKINKFSSQSNNNKKLGGLFLEQNQDSKFEGAFLPMTSIGSGVGLEVTSDIFSYTNKIVNLILVGNSTEFVLIDAGMPKSAGEIKQMIAERMGEDARPKAIVLTHGHF